MEGYKQLKSARFIVRKLYNKKHQNNLKLSPAPTVLVAHGRLKNCGMFTSPIVAAQRKDGNIYITTGNGKRYCVCLKDKAYNDPAYKILVSKFGL